MTSVNAAALRCTRRSLLEKTRTSERKALRSPLSHLGSMLLRKSSPMLWAWWTPACVRTPPHLQISRASVTRSSIIGSTGPSSSAAYPSPPWLLFPEAPLSVSPPVVGRLGSGSKELEAVGAAGPAPVVEGETAVVPGDVSGGADGGEESEEAELGAEDMFEYVAVEQADGGWD